MSTDSVGNVYVFDSATGFHQYRDLAIAAIPEPSTYALPAGVVCLGFAVRRKHKSAAASSAAP